MMFNVATFVTRLVAGFGVAGIAAVSASLSAGQAPPKNFAKSDSPKAVATISFGDDQGRARTSADFKGKVVVLNIWATWCVPCRREMPSLDRLQAALGGPDFEVVPVSFDRKGSEVVRKFFDEIEVRNLAMYLDTSGQAVSTLGAVGLPTTLILNRDGDEIARVVGPAEWDDAAIVEFIRSVLQERTVPTKAVAREPAGAAQSGERFGSPGRGFPWLRALFTW
jgi:thiol-disulfide isomerase/thioredoxin